MVHNLHSFIEGKTEDDFKEEYELLPSGLQAGHNVGKKPCNKVRNRFVAIFPYDHSRVHLEKSSEEGSSDYINANYIDGYNRKNAYIATQGPVPATTGDFWRMIWEQDVSKIVMLANLIEAGKKKCEKYWPELKEVNTAGKMKIKCKKVHTRADYTIREFSMQPDQKDDSRTVYMYHFTTWPDHGVPSVPALLSFWKQVKKTASQTDGPITVHCSAGIGRTGTFIGLDSLVDEARDTKSVNVFECVRKMRDNRINMVQTPEQYQFLHEVLLEAISCRETLYTVASFKEQFTETKTLSTKENARLKQEFKDITSLKKPVSQRDIDTAHLPENKDKNRNQNIVPASSHRPYFSTHVKGTNDYINAVSLPSCKNKDGFLVTQMPLELTVIDFWRMVYEMECTTIVSLTSPDALATSQDLQAVSIAFVARKDEVASFMLL
ncbi:receptor-type tyrosine-protein phosphatase kappa-like [Gigantopelta aegis]|uniref:receptor-type tyrosine-protein phosphatase kappa-like n=1 Tax=Gigantopelta aegis TaxID=1735272 RepID=UPI001B88BA95|nr:receptor-type tyrosine-protein phosphatase kappa-like [Gigantopelta aegis]